MQSSWRSMLVFCGLFLCPHAQAKTSNSPNNSPQSIILHPPLDQETCFSPDEPCAEKLEKFISSATKSIHLAIYSINLENIVKMLIKKSENVQVQIIVDKLQSKGVKSQVGTLFEAGMNIRYGKQKGIMHDKFVIIDGKMMMTGSFNFTNHASLANQENQVYLANPNIVTRYQDRFTKMWDSSVEITLAELMDESNLAPVEY